MCQSPGELYRHAFHQECEQEALPENGCRNNDCRVALAYSHANNLNDL